MERKAKRQRYAGAVKGGLGEGAELLAHSDLLAGYLGLLNDSRVPQTFLGIVLARSRPLFGVQHHVRAASSPLDVHPTVTLPTKTGSDSSSFPEVRTHPLRRR